MAKTAFQKWKDILTPVLVSPLLPGLGGSNPLLQVRGRAQGLHQPRGVPYLGRLSKRKGPGFAFVLGLPDPKSRSVGMERARCTFVSDLTPISLSLSLAFSNIP